jgi:hypothetical protein
MQCRGDPGNAMERLFASVRSRCELLTNEERMSRVERNEPGNWLTAFDAAPGFRIRKIQATRDHSGLKFIATPLMQ